ncbi:uncharacterized protein ABDE67_002776 [Symphorus nematophorus]
MNQSEDREEGVRPSRTTLCGGHEAQRIHQRPESAKPGPEPEPSCVSFKSDQSKEAIVTFKQGHLSDRLKYGRPASDGPGPGPGPGPEPSCVSFKSDRSFHRMIEFKGEEPSAAKSFKCSIIHADQPFLRLPELLTAGVEFHL